MRRRSSSPRFTENTGGDEVQTVYGDLVTFVMMLFILLFVLSYNGTKNNDFITEFQVQFGDEEEKKQQAMTTDALLISRIEHYIDKEELKDEVQVIVDEQKVKIILHPPVLFDSGKAKIKEEGFVILDSISEIFDDVLNPIIVEGHTDNIPINTELFKSNWELSFHRAFSIVQHLIYTKNYSPARLSALGYGEYKPLVPNDSRENRAKNRRIEINIIRVTETEGSALRQSY